MNQPKSFQLAQSLQPKEEKANIPSISKNEMDIKKIEAQVSQIHGASVWKPIVKISVRLPKDLHLKLVIQSKLKGCSQDRFVAELIEEKLKSQQRELVGVDV